MVKSKANDNISHLNRLLANELKAVKIYLLHSKILHDWGVSKLAEKFHAESMDELKHAEELMERIIQLKSVPEMGMKQIIKNEKNIKSVYSSFLKIEQSNLNDLKQAIASFEKSKDYTSGEIARNILVSEEEHIDWIESQIELISKIGTENYLAQNS